MKSTRDIRAGLNSWQDIDIAEYEIAIALGILEPDTPFDTDAKHVFWSSNELGDSLHDILLILDKVGVIEYDKEEMRCRWNSEFNWQKASSRPGR